MTIKAENVGKRYLRQMGGTNCFWAVSPLSLEIGEGEMVLLTGRSGSGKTTLLNMLAGLLAPTEGRVLLDGSDIYSLSDRDLSALRNERMGVVPQGRSLVDTLTAWENILLPARLYGRAKPVEAARQWMERLDLTPLAQARPAELSGGESRRAAIARALAQAPAILFADEPTGDLDDGNTRAVLSALQDYAHGQNKAVFVVSHENDAQRYADRVLRMDGGRIV